MEGGTPTPTAEMSRLATGQYLETISLFLASGFETGRRTSAPLQVTSIRPTDFSDGKASLLVCEDGRHIQVLGPDDSVVGSGSLGASDVTVSRQSDGWKLTERFDAEVSRCS